MPMLKPCAPGGGAQRGHRLLGEVGQLGGLGVRQVRVVGDVPVRHHHQVAAVVRVQVEDRVDLLAARHDQPVLVGLAGIAQKGQPSPAPGPVGLFSPWM